MKRILCLILAGALWLAACSCAQKSPSAKALEKQFQETLSGSTLVGHSTIGEKLNPSEDRYGIEKVSKLSGDTWLFHAHLRYGSHDVTVPLPLTVKWAGDTPIITLTDLTIPGLGTYTARVLIYGGEYAGTWSGKNAGGHVFGKILKP